MYAPCVSVAVLTVLSASVCITDLTGTHGAPSRLLRSGCELMSLQQATCQGMGVGQSHHLNMTCVCSAMRVYCHPSNRVTVSLIVQGSIAAGLLCACFLCRFAAHASPLWAVILHHCVEFRQVEYQVSGKECQKHRRVGSYALCIRGHAAVPKLLLFYCGSPALTEWCSTQPSWPF